MKRPILHEVIQGKPSADRHLANLELEVLELFGQFSKGLGYPKSVGEIYGILYIAGDSMSMGEIVGKLKISLGSASQGLKALKSLEAITVSHCETVRRDLFMAETDFGRFLSCFLKDRIQPGIQGLRETIERIRRQADRDLDAEPRLAKRIDGIHEIYALLAELVPAVSVVLEAKK